MVDNGRWRGKTLRSLVSSDATLSTIDTIKIRDGASSLWVDVYNSDHILDAFEIQVKSHSDAAFITVSSESAQYTSSWQSPIKRCTTDLTSLNSDTHAVVFMDVKGLFQVRLQASASDAGSSYVSTYWQTR
jgi:hypothetical protein